jgi:DNA polymerase III sliding clamp (beta) subunit (PCNA family)
MNENSINLTYKTYRTVRHQLYRATEGLIQARAQLKEKERQLRKDGLITGSNETALDIDGGGDLVIAFNVQFLREALEAAGGDTVWLRANDAKSPAQLTSDAAAGWRYIIMPMMVTE